MAHPIVFGGATPPPANYQIGTSCRFRQPDNTNLERTPSAVGNVQTATFSGWIKICPVAGIDMPIFDADVGTGNEDILTLRTNGTLDLMFGGNGIFVTSQLFRDPMAWYNILLTLDLGNVTQTERIRLYVNGKRVQSFSQINYPADTTTTFPYWNRAVTHYVGNRQHPQIPDFNFNGYMSELHWIDGQALSPTDFGKFDDNGVWVPIKYTGTYGTNGCKLEFKNSAALGTDTSGNGNHWTVNGLTAADQMADSPTNNFCTLDPVFPGTHPLSNGNLGFTRGADQLGKGTIGVSSGKWYFEGRIDVDGGPGIAFGYEHVGGAYSYYQNNGRIYYDGNTPGILSSWAYTTGDIISVALDVDTGTIEYRRNNILVEQTYSIPAGGVYIPYTQTNNTGDKGTINFGQTPFAYTPPAGFKSLCTANLPAVPITNPAKHFNAVLYTGSGTTRSITGTGHRPDLVWIKDRQNSTSHRLFNSVCGTGRWLASNSTGIEAVDAPSLTSFDSDGFGLGDDALSGGANVNAVPYVAWTWKAGGAAVSNTAGSVTSQVSANPSAGFSIVSFTTLASNGSYTIGHGLGATPRLIICRNRATTPTNWYTYHASASASPQSGMMTLNNTDPFTSHSQVWNNTAPTATIFSQHAGVWGTSQPQVAYCFAEIPGYSKFGSYTGSGNPDGPFVYCGFHPRYVLIKAATGSGDWVVYDTARDPANAASLRLKPNLADSESTASIGPWPIDALSNGFKLRNSGTDSNGSGTFIFAAFAEHPFGGSNVSPSPAR